MSVSLQVLLNIISLANSENKHEITQYGHLWRPVPLPPVVDRLASELPVLTTQGRVLLKVVNIVVDVNVNVDFKSELTCP